MCSSLSIDLPGDENKEYSHNQGSLVEQEKVPQDLSPVSSQSTDYKTSLPAASLPENPKKVFQLRSPTTCEFRNLKIYTDAEIKKGRGQEQAYRTFWNEKVKKMAKNRQISNKEIYKRANDEWRHHRSKVLVKDSIDMEEIVKSTYTEKREDEETEDGPQAKKLKAGTVPSNISRVKAASASLESLLAELNRKTEELKKTFDPILKKEIQTELSQLQMSLDSSKSEMRKAQETLRKNLKTKKSRQVFVLTFYISIF